MKIIRNLSVTILSLYVALAHGAQLDLELWDPGQSAHEYKIAARITNRSGEPVALNRLAVKAWFNYSDNSGLEPSSYANNQSIFNANGQWVANVDATSIVIASIAPVDCGDGRRANREAIIRFTDATDKVIPPGGWVESNSSTNALAAWHRADWGSFDRALDYSRITEAGGTSSNRTDVGYFGLYYDDVLVCERKAGAQDPMSGKEPCGQAACATPTLTPTSAQPTTTPSPQQLQLDLELWDPGQSAHEYKIAARITNRSGEPVALNRLAVKAWFNYSGSAGLEPSSYANNQSIFNANGQWVANVDAASVVIATIAPVDCGDGRRGNREATIRFTDAADKVIPPGGWVETNSSTNALAAWHRVDWVGFDRSLDYSRIAEAGNTSSNRTDLGHFGLFLDEGLVCESKASASDPMSGTQPCGHTACATPTLTPTATSVVPVLGLPEGVPVEFGEDTDFQAALRGQKITVQLQEIDRAIGSALPLKVYLPDGSSVNIVGFSPLNGLGQMQGWKGTIEQETGSHAILVRWQGRVAGYVFRPGHPAVSIHPLETGEHAWVLEMDSNSRYVCASQSLSASEFEATGEADISQALLPVSSLPTTCDIDRIDLVVVYSMLAVMDNFTDPPGMEAIVARDIAVANLAFQNSALPIYLNLGAITPFGSEHQTSNDPYEEYQRLVTPGDGFLDWIHPYRTGSGSDLVVYYGKNYFPVAGLALTMTSPGPAFERHGFSLIAAAAAPETLAHELGHNLGCGHAWGDPTPNGAYVYSHGHRFTGEDAYPYRTIMAYAPGIQAPHFSNPDVEYLGNPTGVTGEDVGLSANNAMTIQQNAGFVSRFRDPVGLNCDPTPIPTPSLVACYSENWAAYTGVVLGPTMPGWDLESVWTLGGWSTVGLEHLALSGVVHPQWGEPSLALDASDEGMRSILGLRAKLQAGEVTRPLSLKARVDAVGRHQYRFRFLMSPDAPWDSGYALEISGAPVTAISLVRFEAGGTRINLLNLGPGDLSCCLASLHDLNIEVLLGAQSIELKINGFTFSALDDDVHATGTVGLEVNSGGIPPPFYLGAMELTALACGGAEGLTGSLGGIDAARWIGAKKEPTAEVSQALESLIVAPNPARAEAVALLRTRQGDRARFTLFDLSGKSIWASGDRRSADGVHKQVIPLRGVAPGIYFLLSEVHGDDARSSRDLFKLAVIR